jgi:peptide-methionine (S)-S-oxide reductase
MRYLAFIILGGLSLFALVAATMKGGSAKMSKTLVEIEPTPSASERALHDAGKLAKATFGSGCFWCTEAMFPQLRGVHSVVSGYSGGHVKDPTYQQVCGGRTGHAEVVQITYDPAVITYAELLQAFWYSHDPTTLNQQGHDVGTQYRSVIFYHDDDQRKLAEEYKRKLDDSGAFRAPIVTEIAPFSEFYPAEDYHQSYFEQNGRQPYCAMVIRPKLAEFRSVFSEKLKAAAP